VDAEFRQQPAGDQGADDADAYVTDQTEAEAALRLFPTNDQAKKLLEKAKKKMK